MIVAVVAVAWLAVVIGTLAALHHLRDEVDERPRVPRAELKEYEPEGLTFNFVAVPPSAEAHIKVARQ